MDAGMFFRRISRTWAASSPGLPRSRVRSFASEEGELGGKLEPPQSRGGWATTVSSRFQNHRYHENLQWTVSQHYMLPRRVIVRSLQTLDAQESDRPGMMHESVLFEMVQRFDQVFGNDKTPWRIQEVKDIVEHLKRHTLRRRGGQHIKDGYIEWEQTSRIYELFYVNLNIYERIFFLVDVGESTSILSKLCSLFLTLMIFVSIIVWMLSTLPGFGMEDPKDCYGMEVGDCAPEAREIFKTIESISVYVFTSEYLVRIMTVHSVRFGLLSEAFLKTVLTGSSAPSRPQIMKTPTIMPHPLTAQTLAHDGSVGGGRSDAKLDNKLMTLVKYVLRLDNVVDVLAIAPFWFQLITGDEGGSGGLLLVLRVLRLSRIFRVFKLGKYNEVFTLFATVFTQSTPALFLMLFFILLGCCLFGTLIWFVEQGTWYPQGHAKLLDLGITHRGAYLRTDGSPEPDSLEESPFYSIIHSFWFVIVTITTVGYGDISPTTTTGKLLGALTILNGIIVLAMPIGVIGANFSQQYHKLLDEQQSRRRMQQQQATQARVEAAQDRELYTNASLFSRSSENYDVGYTHSVGTSQVHEINWLRQRILAEAENMDAHWHHQLPQPQYHELSMQLRRFTSDFLVSTNDVLRGKEVTCGACMSVFSVPPGYSELYYKCRTCGGPIPLGPQAGSLKPPMPLRHLTELDALGDHVMLELRRVASVEDSADFGLREALAFRKLWARFTDRCWEFVASHCCVELQVAAPRLTNLKARLSESSPPGQQKTALFSLARAGSSSGGSRGPGRSNIFHQRLSATKEVTMEEEEAEEEEQSSAEHLAEEEEGCRLLDNPVLSREFAVVEASAVLEGAEGGGELRASGDPASDGEGEEASRAPPADGSLHGQAEVHKEAWTPEQGREVELPSDAGTSSWDREKQPKLTVS